MQDQVVTSCCVLSPSSLLGLGSRHTLTLLTLGSVWNDLFILFFHKAKKPSWLECGWKSVNVTPRAHARHEGQLHANSLPSTCHMASLKDLIWHIEWWVLNKIRIVK